MRAEGLVDYMDSAYMYAPLVYTIVQLWRSLRGLRRFSRRETCGLTKQLQSL